MIDVRVQSRVVERVEILRVVLRLADPQECHGVVIDHWTKQSLTEKSLARIDETPNADQGLFDTGCLPWTKAGNKGKKTLEMTLIAGGIEVDSNLRDRPAENPLVLPQKHRLGEDLLKRMDVHVEHFCTKNASIASNAPRIRQLGKGILRVTSDGSGDFEIYSHIGKFFLATDTATKQLRNVVVDEINVAVPIFLFLVVVFSSSVVHLPLRIQSLVVVIVVFILPLSQPFLPTVRGFSNDLPNLPCDRSAFDASAGSDDDGCRTVDQEEVNDLLAHLISVNPGSAGNGKVIAKFASLGDRSKVARLLVVRGKTKADYLEITCRNKEAILGDHIRWTERPFHRHFTKRIGGFLGTLFYCCLPKVTT
mmetsp:Transcript_13949/g.33300  ORF Transcript_13949/g.33300 Transcript_13949/m.33300 type:complete len:365 (-) Transcript_13949:1291-2385(-)